MNKPTLDKNTLRKFGITMAACLAIIALIIALKHRHDPLPVCVASALFIIMVFILLQLTDQIFIYIVGGVDRLLNISEKRENICNMFNVTP